MAPTTDTPLIALTAGDPAGIGPEIVRVLLGRKDVLEAARILVLGAARDCPEGVEMVQASELERLGTAERLEIGAGPLWAAVPADEPYQLGSAQVASGRVALAALRVASRLAEQGRVDALVTAPVCKEALHLAGEEVEGQTELLARWAGTTRYQMVGVSGSLRAMLLTRHLPLADALAAVTTELVHEHLALFDESLRRLGVARPRIALAGLNPHAGENGLLGSQEAEVLEPALAQARAQGLDVCGPHPPDTVFLQASEGRFDGVLALYHDQAFIPLKLLSQGRGLTWIAGLPYLRLSPVHGTAFDIAGKGVASAENLIHALRTAADWTSGRMRDEAISGREGHVSAR